ncbi:MAG: hypothetical protein LBR10_06725 [Prevotellaceae bacterium]|jgi:hypothetical protein|nr:hypothetical protein [Prevotellaceae bacterium]
MFEIIKRKEKMLMKRYWVTGVGPRGGFRITGGHFNERNELVTVVSLKCRGTTPGDVGFELSSDKVKEIQQSDQFDPRESDHWNAGECPDQRVGRSVARRGAQEEAVHRFHRGERRGKGEWYPIDL